MIVLFYFGFLWRHHGFLSNPIDLYLYLKSTVQSADSQAQDGCYLRDRLWWWPTKISRKARMGGINWFFPCCISCCYIQMQKQTQEQTCWCDWIFHLIFAQTRQSRILQVSHFYTFPLSCLTFAKCYCTLPWWLSKICTGAISLRAKRWGLKQLVSSEIRISPHLILGNI